MKRRPGERFEDAGARSRNGESGRWESEVRQMEVGGYSTLHCTGVMRSREERERGVESGGGEDEKQDKAREASRHTSALLWSAGLVVCGLWCAGGRRVWVEMGLPAACLLAWSWTELTLTSWATLSTG